MRLMKLIARCDSVTGYPFALDVKASCTSLLRHDTSKLLALLEATLAKRLPVPAKLTSPRLLSQTMPHHKQIRITVRYSFKNITLARALGLRITVLASGAILPARPVTLKLKAGEV